MAEQGFLSRWSRLKAEAREAPPREQAATPTPVPAVEPAPAADPDQAPASVDSGQAGRTCALPTLDDAMRLGPDSDYSAFVVRGVDPAVRRHALRKLFSDPHFNVVDGLDVYMGDYTRSDPIAPAMLASLQHANAWLRAQIEQEAASAPPDACAANQHDHTEASARQRAPAREHDEH